MKKILFVILIGTLVATVFISCGQGGDAARLARLEEKRDALNAQIEELKAAIARREGTAHAAAEAPAAVRIEAVREAPFRHFIAVQGTVESDNNILVPPVSPGLVKKSMSRPETRFPKERSWPSWTLRSLRAASPRSRPASPWPPPSSSAGSASGRRRSGARSNTFRPRTPRRASKSAWRPFRNNLT